MEKDLEILFEDLKGWTEAWKDIRIKPEVSGRVTMKLYLGQDHKGKITSSDCVFIMKGRGTSSLECQVAFRKTVSTWNVKLHLNYR